MSQCEQNRDEPNSRILIKIYEEYGDFIQSVLWFLLKNPQDREDVYQEVFMTLCMKDDLGKIYGEIQYIKGFLYRLVINKTNEFLRMKIAEKHKFKEYVENFQSRPVREPFREMVTCEQVHKMIDLIQKRLPQNLAEAILTRFQYEDDNEKAARKINVKKRTIIHNASKGLKTIRNIVKRLKRAEKSKDGADYEL